ncbi:hypothetical protein KIPB_008682, partial [Kipferlia bialata]|eukprot:g8682.t1
MGLFRKKSKAPPACVQEAAAEASGMS